MLFLFTPFFYSIPSVDRACRESQVSVGIEGGREGGRGGEGRREAGREREGGREEGREEGRGGKDRGVLE